jgi:hypothetical protein
MVPGSDSAGEWAHAQPHVLHAPANSPGTMHPDPTHAGRRMRCGRQKPRPTPAEKIQARFFMSCTMSDASVTSVRPSA